MSRRTQADLERLILQSRKAAADTHYGKQRRQAAAARQAHYELELQGLQSVPVPQKQSDKDILSIVSRPFRAGGEELAILEDQVKRALASAQHFQAFADKARNDQDRAKRVELVAYWHRRADNAQSRIDEFMLHRAVRSGLDNLH